MSQIFLAAAALFGGTGVALGAFGAHALRSRLTESALSTWETAVQYQLVHALALLAVALLIRTQPPDVASPAAYQVAGWSFLIGVLLFSGSLYLLALGGPRVLGPVTPLGGAAFLLGWIALLVGAVR